MIKSENIIGSYVPTIMIVDDNPENLDMLSGALRESGYHVRSAPSGKLALQAALNEPPDLILLDIMMPDMDGYEVCRRLKDNKKMKDIPVIFITALDKEYNEAKGLSLGAVDYIVKPIFIPVVNSRVNTHVQLKLHRDHLNQLVMSRTAELEKTNLDLLSENAERERVEKELKESLKEKEAMLKEIHHRVKNNLQLISSMLGLQEKYIQNENDLNLFRNSQDRIRSMAMVHEDLYQSGNLAKINFKTFVESQVKYLASRYSFDLSKITLNLNIENILFGIDLALPCAQIINELVSNIFKHAFKNVEAGIINIELFENKKNSIITIIISDNGPGLPEDVDFDNPVSLGFILLKAFVHQYKGTLSVERKKGVKYTVTLKGDEL